MRWILVILSVVLMPLMAGCSRATSAAPQSDIVLIDPGHGGFDGGAAVGDTIEKHLNLAIASTLRDMLYVCGVPVVMTRQSDVSLEEDATASIRERKSSDMRQRLKLYNSAALVISIHQNQFSMPQYSVMRSRYSSCNARMSRRYASTFERV